MRACWLGWCRRRGAGACSSPSPTTAPRPVHRSPSRGSPPRSPTPRPAATRPPTASESPGASLPAEMAHVGLPWRVDVHGAILTDLLGEPSPVGGPPRKLAELSEKVQAALGQRFHPDSPAEVLRA